MLRIPTLEKSYGQRTILQLADFSLPDGIYWIKGENGAGKTTLFRCLAGMHPFVGDIWLDEQYHPQKHAQAYRLRINYGEAEPLFPNFLTGEDLMALVAETKQSPQGQLSTLCDALGIGDYRYQRVDTYSSGMLKKVSLAMALLGQPRWILLDEPLITLDPETQITLLELIAERQKAGTCFVMSSHQAWDDQLLPINGAYQLANQTLTAI
ncbi:MAG TPA: ABC transporter [Cytophagales bacterium]|nr:ABC transporter [Cytophagales bacterium]HAA17322.1 ABC transporter [Cytophagales bacterium]HAP62983.1 ABC transporter [Cytophagales bacterium]